MAYASGKKAWGISDRSGWRYRLHSMRTEWNGSKVGPDERVIQYGWNPVGMASNDGLTPNDLPGTGEIGIVTVVVT